MLNQAKNSNTAPSATSAKAKSIQNVLFFKLAKNLAKIYAKNSQKCHHVTLK